MTKKDQRPVEPDVLLTEDDAARILNLTNRALQAWRVTGRGPVYLRISGRCIRYRRSDIEAWLAGCVRRSTSDPGVTA